MFEILQEKMNLKQSTSKSYYDQKRVKGEIINIDDSVFQCNPWLNHIKLEPKWKEPYVVKNISHHMYLIEMSVNIETIKKEVPRDRLRLVRNKEPSTTVMQSTPNSNELDMIWTNMIWTNLNSIYLVSFTTTPNSTKLPCKLMISLYAVICLYWLKKTMKMYIELLLKTWK